RGHEADNRSDIFSIGCLLYEMISGQRAFSRDSSIETLSAVLHDEPPDLADSGTTVPQDLNRIIQHCLEKSPSARFHSAHDLAFGLRAIQADSKIVGPQTRLGREGIRWRRRIVAAGALVVVTAVAAYFSFPLRRYLATINS